MKGNPYEICSSCIKRNCKINPIYVKNTWTCSAYKKHKEGWKLSEVCHDGTENKMQ